jgi:hypothetical protein
VEVAERVPELIMPAVNALTLHLEGEVCLTFLMLISKGCTFATVFTQCTVHNHL